MKKVEVKLSLPVVAPLLDVIKETADDLRHGLAIPLQPTDLDEEFNDAWRAELISAQNEDCRLLLSLFGSEFFVSGMIEFDEENCEGILRACSAIRLRLRELHLKTLDDELLETGNVEFDELPAPQRRAFTCYLFLATIQELIIQHLDPSIIDS
jgi:hypothetical protein